MAYRGSDALDLVTPYFPVYSTSTPAEPADIFDASVSAILGGSNPILLPGEAWPRCGNSDYHDSDVILNPYIQINVSSPQTPAEFREKVGVEAEPGHAVLLQVFICAEDGVECFEGRLVAAYGDSFLVRVIQVAPESVNVAAVEATRAELPADRFFIPQKVISGWEPGNPELMHEEWNSAFSYDDPQYVEHAPAPGLKLLGFPILGKYYTSSIDECPKEVLPQEGSTKLPDHDCRCLLQLGTNVDSDDNEVYTVGNTFIEQCTVHPEFLSMTIGGTW